MNRLNRLERTSVMTSMLTLMFFILSGCGSSSSDRDLSPIANAGINQTVNEQTTVTLSGSGTAMEGTIDSLSWSQTAGTAVTISPTGAASPSLTIVSPTITVQEVLTFQLTVTDSNGNSDSDTVDITVLPVNTDPVANAGADQTANGGDTVTLSGSGDDIDGTIDSYSWSQTAGQTVTLSNADTANASFVAPQFEDLTDLIFTLTVTDNESGTGTDTVTISVGSDFALADGITGGQLYSKFWATETLFTLANSNLQSQAELDAITGKSDFFRCKQCHGWDRLGRDGGYSNRSPKTTRPNVADLDLASLSQTATLEELFSAIKTGTVPRRDVDADLSTYDPAINPTVGDQMPDYSQIFTDQQIWDLVKYLKGESLDTSMLYDIALEDGTVYPNRGRSFLNLGLDGDAINGDAVFAANCASCHGADGSAILVDGAAYTVGAHTRKKPYEDQHKVKFGHLGSSMYPVLANNPLSDIKDLLKALADDDKYPTRQSTGAINGGRIYSKFWAEETGFTLTNSNLQSQAELDTITSSSNFFRCKQCHGWDRLGREGGYSNRAPKTSRPNVADFDLAAASASLSDQELFDAVKTGTATRRDISTDLTTYDPAVDPTIGDQMPDYSQILTDEQIWNLVDYLKRQALDTSLLYDITLEAGTVYPNRARTFSNIGLDGDAENGDAIFAAECAGCHGDDGTTILVDGGSYTVGAHIRAKPYEDQHKVKFGHLGSSMHDVLSNNPTSDIKDLLKALTDTVKYPDVQVLNGINGGKLYSKFWATETGFSLANSNLQSQTELDAITSRSDFFRCKQCHGWDRLGREGGYSNRASKTSRPNVADFDLALFSATSTLQQIIDAIKTGSVPGIRRDISTDLSTYDPAVDPSVGDQMPNYSQIFTDPQIEQLAMYLKEEALDTSLLYDITLDGGTYPTRGRVFSNLGPGGDTINGAAVFSSKCASCHGADGTAFLVDGSSYTVGAHTRAKPYEDQHKVKFGHLGSVMGPVMSNSNFSDIVDIFKALSDSVAFPDTAPQATGGAEMFVANCGSCHTGNGLGSGIVSDVTGSTAAQITTAIATKDAMSGLPNLTALSVDDIQSIADAL